MRLRTVAVSLVLVAAVCGHVAACGGDEFEGQATNATGGNGGATDGGTSDVFTGDQGWAYDSPSADQGTDAATADVTADVEPEPVCVGTGFVLSPKAPTSPAFDVTYENDVGLVCIGFRVLCDNADIVITSLPTPSQCPSKQFCWAVHVSNCLGSVKLEFVEHKDVGNPGDYCHDTYPGSDGEIVASCQFVINP
jgi:hypothetical protein